MLLFCTNITSVTFTNSLWSNDAIWWHISGSALAQVIACCLTAPSHYLIQCWLLISEVLWNSPDSNFTVNVQTTLQHNEFEDYTFRSLPHFPGANELMSVIKLISPMPVPPDVPPSLPYLSIIAVQCLAGAGESFHYQKTRCLPWTRDGWQTPELNWLNITLEIGPAVESPIKRDLYIYFNDTSVHFVGNSSRECSILVFSLTHLPLVPHICVSELGQYWFR